MRASVHLSPSFDGCAVNVQRETRDIAKKVHVTVCGPGLTDHLSIFLDEEAARALYAKLGAVLETAEPISA